MAKENQIDVVDLHGKKVGTFELAEEVFGQVNEALLWEAVKHYRSAGRAGTHATKKKKLMGALRSALASKFADGNLIVVKSLELKDAKTKDFRKALDGLNVAKTAVIVDSAADNKNLALSTRNLKGVELVAGNAVHPYHLLRYERAIFSQATLEKLQESLKASAPA